MTAEQARKNEKKEGQSASHLYFLLTYPMSCSAVAFLSDTPTPFLCSPIYPFVPPPPIDQTVTMQHGWIEAQGIHDYEHAMPCCSLATKKREGEKIDDG